MTVTEEQKKRYSRQLLLKGVGIEGQERLLEGKVLLVGLGGLGSPAALYLASAGVGTLGLLDPDVVEEHNLQRQVIHTLGDVGKPKVFSAEEKIKELNPDVKVRTYAEAFNGRNAMEILEAYDFAIDATDQFEAKFLIADACHFTGTPYSHAGIVGFEGQTMTVIPNETACYRCVFPSPPEPGQAESPAERGTFGPAAGVLGTLQAGEAVKFLLGKGELLTDSLLLCDVLTSRFKRVRLERDPHCPLCGKKPSISGI